MKNPIGKRFRPWWRSHEWLVVGAVAAASLLLGFIGFRKFFSEAGQPRSLLDIVYLALQLFVLESGSIQGLSGWEIQVARLLAPAVAAYAALKALAVIFRGQLELLRVRFSRGHIVICGLGRRGLLLARKFRERGFRVVVVEIDDENDSIAQCREAGAVVLVGSAANPDLLLKARIHKALRVISVCGDDGTNAEVAVRAGEIIRDRRRSKVTAVVHISEPELCSLLQEQELSSESTENFRLEFSNIFELGARAWVNDFPPYSAEHGDAGRTQHLVIVGLGRLGMSLAVQAARRWRADRGSNGQKLRLTLVDRRAGVIKDLLQTRYPRLSDACELAAVTMDVESSAFEQALFLKGANGIVNVSAVYVSLDNDSLGLAAALVLQRHLRSLNVPIVVRMSQEAGLASLLQEDAGGEELKGLYAFGLLGRTCRPELFMNGTHEILAQAIHEEYLRKQRAEGESLQTNPSMLPWDELPENLKDSNRSQAGHIGKKLRAVGCALAPLVDWDAGLFLFAGHEIELMARMEHDRWVEERKASGWTYSPGPKDIKKKKSPYLVPWDDLPENIRELDRNTVRALPGFLAKAGFQIERPNKA